MQAEPTKEVARPSASDKREEVVRLTGKLDVPAALRISEALRQMPGEVSVTLDLSQVRECHDFALAALIQSVSALPGAKVALRGISQHHARLLKYLGEAAT